MCTLGAKNQDATLKLMTSLRDYVRYSSSYSKVLISVLIDALSAGIEEHFGGRRSGLMRGALDSGASDLGWSPARGHFLYVHGKLKQITLPSQCLASSRCINLR